MLNIEQNAQQEETVLEKKETLGDMLKQARAKQDKTLPEIAAFLRVRVKYLEALENQDYTCFPGLVYGGAFLRSYASYLGLDTKKTAELFKEETAHLVQEPVSAPKPVNENVLPSFKLLVVLAVLIASLCAVWQVWVNMAQQKAEQDASLQRLANDISFISQPSIETDALLTADLSSLNAELEKTQDTDQQTPSETPAEVSQETTDKAQDDTTPTDVLTKNDSVEKPMENTVENAPVAVEAQADVKTPLFFVAQDKVWIEIKQNDKVILNKVLNKGEKYDVPQPADDMFMTTGNAKALEVYVNGVSQGVVDAKVSVKRALPLQTEYFQNKNQ